MQVVIFPTGKQMATVMMKTTLKPATMMVEIVVDLIPIHNTAQNVNALKEEEKAKIQQPMEA